MNIYFNVIKYQLRKKSNILLIIIVCLAFSLIFLVSTYKKSMANYQQNDVFNKLSFKTIWVHGLHGKNNDEEINFLKSLDYVTNVTNIYEYQMYIESKLFITDKFDGLIRLFSSNNKSIPKIVEGTNFPDNDGYYIICPKNFLPSSSMITRNYSKKDIFDLKKYLNKDIEFNYKGTMYSRKKDNKYSYVTPIKLIGLYENNKYIYDEQTCYTNQKTLHDITLNIYTDDLNNYELQKDTGYIVQVNNYANIEKVKNKLNNLGYSFEDTAFFDIDSINKMNSTINSICIITEIIMFIFIFSLFQKEYLDDKKYYSFLKIVGYNKNKIKITFVFSLIFKTILCIIFNIILILLLMVISLLIFDKYPYLLEKLHLLFDYKSILLCIMIMILNVIINTILHIRNVGNYYD